MLDHIFNEGTFHVQSNVESKTNRQEVTNKKRRRSDTEKGWTSKVVKFTANITPVSRLGDKEFLKVITELGEWTARRYMTS